MSISGSFIKYSDMLTCAETLHCECFFHAAAFGHQTQPTFSPQTPAVAPYTASTPALGRTEGPPPYPAGSIAPPPYPGPPALPLGSVDSN